MSVLRALVLSLCGLVVSGLVPSSFSPRQQQYALRAVVDGADCVDENSCSAEELESLLAEVKSKASEIKELEAKLTALNKDDSSSLKKMLAAEECELNGFDGCAAWYYDD